ncbi:hypothetical protein ABEB36_014874 [Hypothenemus hampei]|uniref:Leucine-binding protein domain-containing protein n=1 Tax=Hypothenemus hampei TaxID=57062 RepID=A0ABD1E1F1_HYPHA
MHKQRVIPWLVWAVPLVFTWFLNSVGGGRLTQSDDYVLHIGGIFPIAGQAGWQGGQACMPAARLALEDVNARKDILPGYVLKMHSNDSETEHKFADGVTRIV